MKTFKIILFAFAFLAISPAHAQFWKKLGDKVGDAAERGVTRTVERRVERETEKSTDRTLDSVIEAPKSKKKRDRKKKKKNNGNIIGGNTTETQETTQEEITINSNFDFEAGNVPIFTDVFDRDLPGDFPAKWDTNGSGEIVTANGKKWLRLGNNSTFVPMTSGALPDDYTVEFDLLTKGLDRGTSSQAFLKIMIENNNNFSKANTYAMVDISPCQFISSPGYIEKRENGQRQLWNDVGKDYRTTIVGTSKVSIAVNKTRMRVWINDNKIVDVPRLVPEDANYFKLVTKNLRDDRNLDELYISNFKIAKSGQDNRSKLLTEGKLSTNAILFNTGSSSIKSGADAILQEVAGAMNEVTTMKIRIIGHTDSDGSDASNLKLSKDRASSVKQELVSKYGINGSRILTDGMGASQPIASNDTADGKSQNRRVEFIKL